ncbi:SH3 domain-containing protein [Apibacter sp. B3889]|uniref:SH3 domain-containing protein n=1 Tax=unclassified Apibacter TaxID=2630820 RepID=UPI0013297143|nr:MULTISPECIES: SH3 domain-containing protein [unclassified Apibacter]MXO34766.1 SH3 domain-containing protein [Apibacter sp. B3883]MXO42130.1 SH3 domain-containing protein [Apibacter sp. B3889]MXP03700.1 SH3 domain-containing protein [Apibacter sp. B3887]MXP08064.1 SH3 domain-containing protein [Apibacter sp. B3935]
MALQDKYADLINKAKSLGTTNLSVKEQNNVLYIDGEVPNGESKDQLWATYNKIDPDFRSADLILNINVSPNAPSSKYKVTTQSSNLNIRKGPGTDQPILGKAAHQSTVTFLSKYNDDWYLIRSEDGTEGYCNTEYLTAI